MQLFPARSRDHGTPERQCLTQRDPLYAVSRPPAYRDDSERAGVERLQLSARRSCRISARCAGPPPQTSPPSLSPPPGCPPPRSRPPTAKDSSCSALGRDTGRPGGECGSAPQRSQRSSGCDGDRGSAPPLSTGGDEVVAPHGSVGSDDAVAPPVTGAACDAGGVGGAWGALAGGSSESLRKRSTTAGVAVQGADVYMSYCVIIRPATLRSPCGGTRPLRKCSFCRPGWHTEKQLGIRHRICRGGVPTWRSGYVRRASAWVGWVRPSLGSRAKLGP